ncbi:general secretion pathway protein GspD [Sphingobacterium sp. SRCM116780]|uniref:general secretion pathway protein GspD n=1 Tax=Sphingobacterium sp. SRCM116780 TaxID=2907623 RepID=UPI001F2420AC|nr:general secretion pathway protein GspD [Sphingobacterium sp. SRCM116780]UIR54623.1 general secretion pathway protein GspD [Sphingobacterium sp. SRCM116780]
MNLKIIIITILVSLCALMKGVAQTSEESFYRVQQRLDALAVTVPGLEKKVKLSVSGVSVQEFLRALAQSNDLNINVDQSVNFSIVNNFTGETAKNVLLFLAKTYSLDINVIGSIMSIHKLPNAQPIFQPKDIKVQYNRESDGLSYDLQNDTLARVAQKITALSGKNLIVPTPLLQKSVTGFMAEAPFETALEKLAYVNGLKYKKTNDNVYVFESLVPGEELFINDDQQTDVRFRPGNTNNAANGMNGGMSPDGQGMGGQPGNYALYGKSQTGKGKLFTIQATNTPIIELIKRASEESNVNYFIYSQIDGNITTSVKDISFDQFLTSIFQGTPYTFRVDDGMYLIGNRRNEGLRENKIIHLQHRSIDTMMTMIPMDWRKDVEIKEFREQNMLLVSGSGPQIREIEQYVKKLDKLVPMVLIEVTMLDIQKGNTIKTGISMGIADSIPRTGGSIADGMTFGSGSINRFLSQLGKNNSFNIGKVTPNFYVRLQALEENKNVELRSVPKLSTLNGHHASLSIGSTQYYKTQTQNVIPSLQTTSVFTEQYTAVDANLKIDIWPVISGDDQITLKISVDISDFIGTVAKNEPPPTSNSKFESIIRAHNEDMIVLGGIERTENGNSGRGIPILSRIPILKWLFSSREKTTKKVVSVVFIKPTIIY